MLPDTHAIAVFAIIMRENRFLLLERKNPPKLWAPPGGKLNGEEDPIKGLLRECKEETGLTVKIDEHEFMDCKIKFLEHSGRMFLALFFQATILENEINLSEEHSRFEWMHITKISKLIKVGKAYGSIDLYNQWC